MLHLRPLHTTGWRSANLSENRLTSRDADARPIGFMRLPRGPVAQNQFRIPALDKLKGKYTKRCTHTNTYKIAVLNSEQQKQPKCPSPKEWVN